ncbi:MAG: DUF1223 domain-containing protein [Rhizobiaceae bacterium]|nr:DUF1223 domain-containing protein [Rhizobiaceae bacterium]
MDKNRRILTGTIMLAPIIAVSGMTLGSAQAAEIYSPKAILEVFTSQGCSSCPPADEFVTSIYRNKDILALAWHVDYWDYLGWKDTFAKPEHAVRQRRYSKSFEENQIYTPQAIMNGRSHTVGSRSNKIKAVLKDYEQNLQGLTVPINVSVIDDALDIQIAYGSDISKATLWMVYFTDQEVVKVEKGENRGKDLTYSNIVRDIELIGMMEPDGLKMMLPLKDLSQKGYDSCALLLQQTSKFGTPGPIIGATVIRDLKKS